MIRYILLIFAVFLLAAPSISYAQEKPCLEALKYQSQTYVFEIKPDKLNVIDHPVEAFEGSLLSKHAYPLKDSNGQTYNAVIFIKTVGILSVGRASDYLPKHKTVNEHTGLYLNSRTGGSSEIFFQVEYDKEAGTFFTAGNKFASFLYFDDTNDRNIGKPFYALMGRVDPKNPFAYKISSKGPGGFENISTFLTGNPDNIDPILSWQDIESSRKAEVSLSFVSYDYETKTEKASIKGEDIQDILQSHVTRFRQEMTRSANHLVKNDCGLFQ